MIICFILMTKKLILSGYYKENLHIDKVVEVERVEIDTDILAFLMFSYHAVGVCIVFDGGFVAVVVCFLSLLSQWAMMLKLYLLLKSKLIFMLCLVYMLMLV